MYTIFCLQENVAVHPNQWYQAAVQYRNAKTGATLSITNSSSSIMNDPSTPAKTSDSNLSFLQDSSVMDTL